MPMERLLRPYAAPAPGAAVLVLRAGQPPDLRTAGLARVPDGPPVTRHTSFRLASITKAFTAKAVDLAIYDGALDLDTPIRALRPELPSWADPIRIGHLLAHTSGIPAYEDLVPTDRSAQLDDREVLALIAEGPPPRRPPGARFQYDNGGYVLLGLALEAATGQPFPGLLRDRIFAPLAMTRTVAHVEGRTRVEDRAIGYARAGEGTEGDSWAEADQGITTATLGDGGIYSSLDDLARWDAALRQPGYQPDAARLASYSPAAPPRDAAPHRPSAASSRSGVAYGWGWYLDVFEGRRRQRHDGWSTGFQNEFQRFPDDGLTIIVLSNRSAPSARPLAEDIARRAIAGRS